MLKLQYFGHLMRRTDSFEKTLMLGNIEGGRRKGQQRMRWLHDITIKPATGATTFGGTASYTVPDYGTFSGYRVTNANMTFWMCKLDCEES